jgi:hypothetical protein
MKLADWAYLARRIKLLMERKKLQRKRPKPIKPPLQLPLLPG